MTSRGSQIRKKVRGCGSGILAFLLALLLAFSASNPCQIQVEAVVELDGSPVNLIGYTNSSNGSALRPSPFLDGSPRIDYLSQGTKVEVIKEVQGDVPSGYSSQQKYWYYVRDVFRDRYGYVHTSLVTLTDIPINQPAPEPDQNFEQYLTAQGFPESYKPALRALHQARPNWHFVAFHIKDVDSPANNRKALTFTKALDAQMDSRYPSRSLVTKGSILSHRNYDPKGYNYKTDTWTVYDAGGWLRASREIVAYAMDPRNFLEESKIFQFEQLTYYPGVHTIEAVQSVLRGSFMENKQVTFMDLDGVEKTMSYPQIFMEAAERTGVNPFFLAQRCLTEVGTKGSDSVHGKVVGYEDHYNFYNIGASAGSNPILNGLKYARYGSSGNGPSENEKRDYLLPWDNPWKAIVGGANWIGRGYILAGQDTSYLQKFNLDGDTYGTYWHQYMGNINAPAIESARVFNMYLDQKLLNTPFVFRIPVLSDMPKNPSPYPSDNKSRNNWLKSISIQGGEFDMSPNFNPEVYAYNMTVWGETDLVTIAAQAYHGKCTVKNAGTVKLKPGMNEITLEVVSESGHKRNYKLSINFTGEEGPDLPPVNVETTNDYQVKDGYITNAWPDDGRNKAGQIMGSLDLPQGFSSKAFDAGGKEAEADTPLGTGARIDLFYEDKEEAVQSLILIIYGDANGDGQINSIDLSHVIDVMYQGKTWTSAQMVGLDANRDGYINSIDLSLILDHMYRGQMINQK